MVFTYMRADENVLWGGTVSGGAAATYDDDWLVDGRGTRPARATSGSQTWTVTALASGYIDMAVVHSHNIDPAKAITIGGGVSIALVGPTARTDGIPVNPYGIAGSPATTGSVSVAVSGNTKTLTIGELLAGRKRALTYGLIAASLTWGYLPIGRVESQAIGGSIPNFDRGLTARWLKGSVYVTADEKSDMEDWFEATKNDTKPSVMVPFDENDAWVGSITDLQFSTTGRGILAAIDFNEWARKRWAA